MSWSANMKQGYEVAKVRNRVISYCRGFGLDIGCGGEKIKSDAIGIDLQGDGADIRLDLSANDSLRMFANDSMDFVFSSHVLEDFKSPKIMLQEWWRVVKPGGYLILYGPDPDFYPRIGTEGANPNHKYDLYWQDVWKIINSFASNAKIIHHSRHNESNEYSWLLIVKKRYGLVRKVYDVFRSVYSEQPIAFPRCRKTKKEALVIRYGALGDAIWATPILRQLKKEGYHVVYNCTDYSAQVLKENPNIDEFLIQGKDEIPNSGLEKYWAEISKGFDKVINLSQSVEQKLLVAEGIDEAFGWNHKKRHVRCNYNYIDATMATAGYPDMKGEQPELFFSESEHDLARHFRQRHKDTFLILWSLSGSSFHKLYPWSEYVAGDIAMKHRDEVGILTVGDEMSRLLEWQNPITDSRSGLLTVRQSMILTQYVDLVIGPETGILNAASCFDTPKIVFLSHSSKENLTKYWRNCTALESTKCACHPCHRLIYTNNVCPKDSVTQLAKCMSNITPQETYKAFERYFSIWKEKRRS